MPTATGLSGIGAAAHGAGILTNVVNVAHDTVHALAVVAVSTLGVLAGAGMRIALQFVTVQDDYVSVVNPD